MIVIHAVGIAGYLWLRTSLPQIGGELTLSGLDAPVVIERDRYGIATIRAGTDHDAYFALGFTHAQDRLFQMEFTRRLGTGRLSEIVGNATLETDRFMRLMDFHRQAEAQLAAASPPLLAALDAYAAGVNAYMATHGGAWPPEFYVMRLELEPWQPVDSLIWGRLMALQLSGNWGSEYLRARLAKKLTDEQLDWLWPASGDRDVARTMPPANSIAEMAPLPAFPGVPDLLAGASNAWAVSPSRSASGGALLAGDPHLAIRLPGYWYLARIVTPDWTLAGATAPGVPLLIIGHNENVAWSFTTTHGDTQDLFLERTDPEDPDRYLTPDGSMPFSVRHETIMVRNEAVPFDIRSTSHGPVVSDIGIADALADDDTVVALAWSCLDEDDRTADALFQMNHATDANALRTALDDFGCPLQNVVYADGGGTIGLAVAGRVPVRRALSGGGQMPATGWSGAYDWIGFIRPEDLPRTDDPAIGWIANANNDVTPPGYPHFIAAQADAPYRIGRIDDVLAAAPGATIDDMTALQTDTLSLAAKELLPPITTLLRGHTSTDLERETLAILDAWNGHVDSNEAGPLILHAFMQEATRAVFADELDDLYGAFGGWNAPLLLRVLNDEPGANGWCDDVATDKTESCGDSLGAAFDAAVASLADSYGDDPSTWRWGAAHIAEFSHAIWGRIPLANRLLTPSVEAPGDTYTVNRGTPAFGTDTARFPDIHAAGLRFAIDMADPSSARYMIAGGQSGNLFSSHYDDLIPLWRDGEYLSIVGEPETTLDLMPAEND
jgi:penicillin amidase